MNTLELVIFEDLPILGRAMVRGEGGARGATARGRIAGRSRLPVNGIDHAASSGRTASVGELRARVVDERTLELLERHRRGEDAFVADRGWLVRRSLLAADVLALSLTFVIVQLAIGVASQQDDRYPMLPELLFFLATLPLWVVVAKLHGLYDRDEDRADNTTADDLVGVLHVLTIGIWVVFATAAVSHIANPAPLKFLMFWGSAIVLVTLARAGARAVCRRHAAYIQNTLIIGAGEVGQTVAATLLRHPEFGINVVGFIDSAPKEPRGDVVHIPVLGEIWDVPDLVSEFAVQRVIIAFSGDSDEETLGLMRALKSSNVRVDVVPRLFELVPPSADIHMVEGLPLIGLPRPGLSRSSMLLKRTLDVVISIFALVLLSPFLAAISVLIKLDSRGPVLFRQLRMGQGERKFTIYKFRTMVQDAEERKAEVAHLNKHARTGCDARMFKIPGDPRTTRIGSLLRRYSIDELPQLINVVRGEMSLVGPRPLILGEYYHVDNWGRRRLDLRPGMTGLWQVLGRDSIPFEEMIRLDYQYVTTWSLSGDLWVLLRTFPNLGRGDRQPLSPVTARR
jgi:exopolysaccharide biosynthesis polyprenyl glycosylphosphotransferase